MAETHGALAPPSRSWLRPSLDWLLVFVPLSIVLKYVPGLHNDTALFITSCLAIVPLAGWLGRATEHLAEQVGEGIGGLLNATFGNAAELIIALMALSRGLSDIVKASITGSIIGNILLVAGLSFLLGGLKYPRQTFNRTAVRSSITSLILAGIALFTPTLFHIVAGPKWTSHTEQHLSLAIASVLLLMYGLTLLFSLKTHKQLFMGEVNKGCAEAHDENHEPWSRGKSITILIIATMFVALISEFLVGSVEAARHALGFTEVFVGVIVVAIIGNAAEHSSAVMMALKDKMDLSLGIAIGSSLQISLFVAPLLVFASYLFGQPMDLEFKNAEIVAMGLAIVIMGQICGDGESNWLEGAQLMAVYVILGIMFFFLPGAMPTSSVLPSDAMSGVAAHP